MTRWVDQTTFGFPGGNCFSACVAGLLGVELLDVPYFMDEGEGWFERFNEWLQRRHRYWALCFKLAEQGKWRPDGLHILSGRSPRGKGPEDYHSVVADGDRIVHDPHPSREGLLTHHDVVLLVPQDPWKEPE